MAFFPDSETFALQCYWEETKIGGDTFPTALTQVEIFTDFYQYNFIEIVGTGKLLKYEC